VTEERSTSDTIPPKGAMSCVQNKIDNDPFAVVNWR